MSPDDFYKILEKVNPEALMKIEGITTNIVATLMDTDAVKEKVEQVIISMAKDKMNQIIKEAIRSDTTFWGAGKSITGWGADIIKSEMKAKLNNISVETIIYGEIKKFFDSCKQDIITKEVKDGINEATNKRLDSMLTNEYIKDVIYKIFDERLKK